MKERPIPFRAPMVRALLAGEKTQTRRIFKAKNGGVWPNLNDRPGMGQIMRNSPYGQPGDRLWVQEAFVQGWPYDPVTDRIQQFDASGNKLPLKTWYRADGTDIGWADEDGWEASTPWKSSTQMPRHASRITLEITAMRVERLQDISESDCWAEGIEKVMYDFDDAAQIDMANRLGCCIEDMKPLYALLWEQKHGTGSWDTNPWVWVIDFRRTAQEGGSA